MPDTKEETKPEEKSKEPKLELKRDIIKIAKKFWTLPPHKLIQKLAAEFEDKELRKIEDHMNVEAATFTVKASACNAARLRKQGDNRKPRIPEKKADKRKP